MTGTYAYFAQLLKQSSHELDEILLALVPVGMPEDIASRVLPDLKWREGSRSFFDAIFSYVNGGGQDLDRYVRLRDRTSAASLFNGALESRLVGRTAIPVFASLLDVNGRGGTPNKQCKKGNTEDETRCHLRHLLQDPTREMRLTALSMLGKYGTSEDAKLVRPLLDDKELGISALLALADLQPSEALPRIVPLLDHDEPGKRGAAAYALRTIRSETALPFLVQRLTVERNAEILMHVIGAIGTNGDAETASLLLPLLDTSDERIFRVTIDTLGRIGDERVLPHILSHLSSLPDDDLGWSPDYLTDWALHQI
ncbi:MAG: HEAT repeat domain-containing protein, partial [Bacteroidota bacterium]